MIKANKKKSPFGDYIEFECVKCGGMVRSFLPDILRFRFHLCNAAYLISQDDVIFLNQSASEIVSEAVNVAKPA